VQQVHALGDLARLLALLADQLDAARREEGALGGGVLHLYEPSVKIFRRKRVSLVFAVLRISKGSLFTELVTY